MDDNRFDDLGRALGGHGTRRGALRLLIGAALGALAGRAAAETPAGAKSKGRRKGKGKGKKKGCPKKPCPQGYQRNKRTCKCECVRTTCSGGKEFDVDQCRCACPRGLRECQEGCVGPNECCPGDPPCPEEPRGCCYSPGVDVCTIDGCCAELDGKKACNNFCVDTTTDRNHCGDCNVRCGSGEGCVDGECVETSQCPGGQQTCPGYEDGPFCARPGHSCCGDYDCNPFRECCNAAEGLCCLKGRCVEGRCCPEGREVCAGKCCLFGESCCGGECCSASQCVNNMCCRTGVCGSGTGSKVCRTEQELCCTPSSNTDGWACPRGEDAPGGCAPNGRCCPPGTYYEDGCDKCCRDIRDLCSECIAPTPGRFS
jgi:hypothetical protein